MRWRGERESDNVEDRRGTSLPRGVGFGGLSGLGLVAVVVISWFFGIDPTALLQNISQQQPSSVSNPLENHPVENDDMRKFVAVVLGETEDVWYDVFRKGNQTYQPPKLVLFSQTVQSACGIAGSAVGPFYCPGDRKVYLDLKFFKDLQTKFGVSGDFAQAYVIAHEVGHHVQTLLGVTQKVADMKSRANAAEKNRLSVMVELQADCLAGVWAHQTEKRRRILEAGDIEEGLNAASAVGDDRIQKRSQGYVVPDSFTHGSSSQRVRWFKIGLENGTYQSCNTFKANQL
jgi:uncharacterized protein